jgi:hypothetical protein
MPTDSNTWKHLLVPTHTHDLVTEIAKAERRHKYAIVERALDLYQQQAAMLREHAAQTVPLSEAKAQAIAARQQRLDLNTAGGD